MTELQLARVFVALIVPIQLESDAFKSLRRHAPSRSGPLPVRSRNGGETDARKEVILPAACETLYKEGRRFHALLSEAQPIDGTQLEALAMELLVVSERRGFSNALLALHCTGPASTVALCAALREATRHLREGDGVRRKRQYARLVADNLGLHRETVSVSDDVERIHRYCFAQLVGPQPTAEDVWTAPDIWRWSLAAAEVPPRSWVANPKPPVSPGETLPMRRRKTQVLRDGIATVLEPAALGSTDAHDEIERSSKSVYLDVVLLGVAEKLLLRQVSRDLAEEDDLLGVPGTIRAIQRRVRIIRNRWWWTEISEWGYPDAMLRSFERANALGPLLEQVGEETDSLSQQLTGVLNQRTNLLLVLLAVIAAVGAAGTVLQTLKVPDTGLVALILAVVAVSMILVFAVLGGHELVSALGRDRER